MKLRPFLLPSALLVSSLNSYAQTYTGNDLLNDMSASNPQQVFAMGYVAGAAEAIRDVIDAQRLSNNQRKGLLPTYCSPGAGIPREQLLDIVKKYLLDNPASRHDGADVQVYAALTEAFPCPANPK